jgi:hypothetical protein
MGRSCHGTSSFSVALISERFLVSLRFRVFQQNRPKAELQGDSPKQPFDDAILLLALLFANPRADPNYPTDR